MTAKWSRWRYLEARFVTILTIRFKGALVPAWPADRSPTRTGPVEADGAVDAQNAPTAPWKTLLVFHELPQGFPHPITHDKPRKSPESYWETRIDPSCRLRLWRALCCRETTRHGSLLPCATSVQPRCGHWGCPKYEHNHLRSCMRDVGHRRPSENSKRRRTSGRGRSSAAPARQVWARTVCEVVSHAPAPTHEDCRLASRSTAEPRIDPKSIS